MKKKLAIIHCDGACTTNPGPGGIGVVVEYQGQCYEFAQGIGIVTNNAAEWAALCKGLAIANELGATEVEVYLDSLLVVQQVNGRWRVKKKKLRPFYDKAKELLSYFKSYTIKHIYREQNILADALAVEAAKKDEL